MRKDTVIYQLTVEDIQTVSEEYLKRKLNSAELKKVINSVGDYIPWHDSIESTLTKFAFKPKAAKKE
jgi:hypothetical protein